MPNRLLVSEYEVFVRCKLYMFFACFETPCKPSNYRPVNIAVYGHPRYAVSEYILEVIVVEAEEEFDYFKSDEDMERERKKRSQESDEEESSSRLIWSVLWQILEIIIEVIL